MRGLEATQRHDARFDIFADHAATVEFDTAGLSGAPRGVSARLVNLSVRGVRLALSEEVAKKERLRLRLPIAELAMELHFLAEVCWTAKADDGSWHVGCELRPALTPALLDRLASSSEVDRRKSERSGKVTTLRASWPLLGRSESVTIRNYSRGGFCLSSRRAVNPGDRFELALEGSSGGTLTAEARWQLRVGKEHWLCCVLANPADYGRLRAACEHAAEPSSC